MTSPWRIMLATLTAGTLTIAAASAQEEAGLGPYADIEGPEIEGWGPLRFGMSLEEVIAADVPGGLIEDSIAVCQAHLTGRNCSISGNGGGVVIGGLAFTIESVGIDGSGTLDSVFLYLDETGLGRSDCLAAAETMLDQAVHRYGSLYTMSGETGNEQTPEGVAYHLYSNFVISMTPNPAIVRENFERRRAGRAGGLPRGVVIFDAIFRPGSHNTESTCRLEARFEIARVVRGRNASF